MLCVLCIGVFRLDRVPAQAEGPVTHSDDEEAPSRLVVVPIGQATQLEADVAPRAELYVLRGHNEQAASETDFKLGLYLVNTARPTGSQPHTQLGEGVWDSPHFCGCVIGGLIARL